MPWSLRKDGAGSVLLDPLQPNWLPLTGPGSVLNGVPQLVSSESGETASAAELYGDLSIRIYFPSHITYPTTFRLRANDPAFRGPAAQYLSAQQWLEVPDAGPAVFQSASYAGSEVQVTVVADGGKLGCLDTWAVTNTNTGEHPDRVWYVGGTLFLNFPTPPTSGEAIQFLGGPSNWLNANGGDANATTLYLP